ncbi:DUF3138 family protein [Herminiimonas sp. CN]|uniref:DUF3138 family protein n=1 Tax=Herminiimonas sp. CN TaxID=1349818 RepID=UPI0004741174|nr:DUF3138 family protein [Herminiimonas sp. CN]
MKKIVLAIAMAFPAAAFAQSAKDLKAELEALKIQVQQLEAMVEKVSAKADMNAAAGAADSDMKAEFNRVKLNSESMSEQLEANGLKGLKVTGYMDPTYIMNQRQNTSSFVFMKNFGDQNSHGGPGSNASYAYDNAFLGSALISFEKEMEGGTKWLLELMPHKSAGDGGGYNSNSIVNQAFVTIPMGSGNKFIAGQVGSWQGYEFQRADMKKTVTGNLLFDFTGPTFMTGVGLDHLDGKWETKAIVGNLNNGRITDHRSPTLHWRVDYTMDEFTGIGAAGLHGKPVDGTSLNYGELDASFTRGDITMSGQIEAGQFKRGSFTGEDTNWFGLSALAAYKFTPRLEGVVRGDYIRNEKNGGGTPNLTFPECDQSTGFPQAGSGTLCGDARNGFGPSLTAIQAFNADPSVGLKGTNRSALTLGMNYTISSNALLKFELRHDHASQDVFYDVKSGTYKNNNTLLGVSTLVKF